MLDQINAFWIDAGAELILSHALLHFSLKGLQVALYKLLADLLVDLRT